MDHYRSLYLRLIKPSTNTLVANGYVGNVRRMVFEVQICGAQNDRSVIVQDFFLKNGPILASFFFIFVLSI